MTLCWVYMKGKVIRKFKLGKFRVKNSMKRQAAEQGSPLESPTIGKEYDNHYSLPSIKEM